MEKRKAKNKEHNQLMTSLISRYWSAMQDVQRNQDHDQVPSSLMSRLTSFLNDKTEVMAQELRAEINDEFEKRKSRKKRRREEEKYKRLNNNESHT